MFKKSLSNFTVDAMKPNIIEIWIKQIFLKSSLKPGQLNSTFIFGFHYNLDSLISEPDFAISIGWNIHTYSKKWASFKGLLSNCTHIQKWSYEYLGWDCSLSVSDRQGSSFKRSGVEQPILTNKIKLPLLRPGLKAAQQTWGIFTNLELPYWFKTDAHYYVDLIA